MESEDYDDNYGFAFSQENISPSKIQNWNESDEWEIITFELKGGDYADYIVNDLNIPLCSERLKIILQNSVKLNRDNLLFYPVTISYENKDRQYYFLKPPVLEDVIDIEKSTFKNNTILNPYFISEKIEDVFRCDYDTSYLFVTENLMKILNNKQITGIDFYSWSKLPDSEKKQTTRLQ